MTVDQPTALPTQLEDTPTVVLSLAATPTERELVTRWLREHGRPSDVVLSPGDLPARVAQATDVLVVPVRVAWLPRERSGVRRATWSDLLSLRDPRHPSPREQARIAEREPDRWHVVVGEPARLSELRSRFAESTGSSGGPAELAEFVTRQATLALERAERDVIGDRYKVPRLVIDEITSRAVFADGVRRLADELDLPEAEVAERATAALTELVAVQSRLAIDLFSTLLGPMHKQAFDVQVDVAGLERLRQLNRQYGLVFLPSHRSYADPLVLADVLAEHDFPRNHVMGGNNLSFWPLGPLARRAGIVFIRRSFGDDEIYKFAVEEYFGYLVAKRFNLEWYLEGGRSRTGKLRPPRYGLLHYLAGALERGRADDVYLVPVSITYEHLAEVEAMAAEQGGSTKQPEGIGWLARYMRAQQRRAGKTHVRFGDALPLRERLASDGASDADKRLALQKVAFEVAVGINSVTPVMPNALVTLALLGVRDCALTLDGVRQVLDPMLDYVEARKLPGVGLDQLRQAKCVRAVLHDLADKRVVSAYTGGVEPVYSIGEGQHLVAAFYRNNAIHWFVNRAIVELSMLHVAEQGSTQPVPDAWQEAKRIRDLLKFEFFFPERDRYQAELEAEMALIDPAWEQGTATVDGVGRLLAGTGFLMASRVLRSFVDAIYVVADRLAVRDPRKPLDKKAFLAECAGVGQQMLLQGRLHGPESLSRELFASALKLAANRDLVDPGREELRERRLAFAAEVRDVLRRIVEAERIDVTARQTRAGSDG